MSRRIRVAALFLVIGTGALGAQNRPPADLQVPTFKVQVEYVEVNIVVTDSAGNFVRDLKKEDFQIFEDGKPQSISAFTIVDIPVDRYERPLYVSEPIEPDVKTNERPFDGRVYVMVIDDLHTHVSRTPRVTAAARKFIREHMGANDLMAVVHTAGPVDGSQELTNSKPRLLAAVDKTFGDKLESATLTRMQEYIKTYEVRERGDRLRDPRELERAANAKRTLDSLRDISQWFNSVHGRRKTILFFSEGIDFDTAPIFDTGPAYANTGAILLDTMRETIAAATRANVSIYGIDPRGLGFLSEEAGSIGSLPDDQSLGLGARSLSRELNLSQDSLRELSDETGGFAAVNANDLSTAFDRIVRDNSSYYLLAYYPPADKPGKAHRIDVKVSRPAVTTRGRQAYVTPKPEPPKNTKSTSSNENLMTPELREVMASPIPVSGLSMYVFAAPFKGAGGSSVLIGTEIDGSDLRLNRGDKLVLSYLAVDAEGKVRGGTTDAVTLNLQPDTKQAVAQSGIRVLRRLDLPPGRYQLRVAAHDSAGGRIGSVMYDLDVPDFNKNALTMSGLVITSKVSGIELTVRPDQQLKDALPGPPVAIRRFQDNDELALFVEAYDNQGSRAHKVEITASVTTDEGKVLFKNNEVRDSTELDGKRGGYGYATRIPLKGLAPGSYVLTVSARSTLGGSTVQRQLQFTIGGRG